MKLFDWCTKYDYMAGRCCTTSYSDRIEQVILLKAAKQVRMYEQCLKLIAGHRKTWKAWIFRTQRHWQCKTRRKSKGNNGSIAIREKYVRCQFN